MVIVGGPGLDNSIFFLEPELRLLVREIFASTEYARRGGAGRTPAIAGGFELGCQQVIV